MKNSHALCRLNDGSPMNRLPAFVCLLATLISAPATAAVEAPETAVARVLPADGALWSMDDAHRQANALRESICLNGLWQFKPATEIAEAKVPRQDAGWHYFKVPGIWPATGSGKDGPQTIVDAQAKPARLDVESVEHAWYRRTIEIPLAWAGRRLELDAGLIQSFGQVFIDGERVGDFYYPGGLLDVSRFLTPGQEHELAILVTARPDPDAGELFMAPDRVVAAPKKMPNCGITGDLFLHSTPAGMTIGDVHVVTSVKKKTITCDTGLRNLQEGTWHLEAVVREGARVVKEFKSEPFRVEARDDVFRTSFSDAWRDPKLWDVDTPENLYQVEVSLHNEAGERSDCLLPQTFGFREFTIDGRDFRLNGKVIHLRSLHAKNMIESANQNTADAYDAIERRAREVNANFYIAANYNFAPGRVGYLDGFYKETSKRGLLTSLSVPHGAHFQWKLDEPETARKYRALTAYLVRRYQNLPGIVLYAANHNATGYYGDQNPLKIDGVYSPDEHMAASNGQRYQQRRQALLTLDIIRELDSTRPVYNHQSGSLGGMYTINCYLNWTPRQERSDWLTHWSEKGVVPLFMMEWGMPHVASWSSFRGPAFIWATEALQCVWYDEYNAAILGESAYRLGGKERYMAAQERICNEPCHFNKLNWFSIWEDTQRVWAYMIEDNFPSLRAQGLSGILPWDSNAFWKWKRSPSQMENPNRFTDIKKPGIVADRISKIDDVGDYQSNLSISGLAVREAWKPWAGWIAGKPGAFTAKDHNYAPGETVEKTLVILNDTRHAGTVAYQWRVAELDLEGSGSVSVDPGARRDPTFSFAIPSDYQGSALTVSVAFRYPSGEAAKDEQGVDVCAVPTALPLKSSVALFDPEGTAAPLLKTLGVPFVAADEAPLPETATLLVIGRNALAEIPFELSGRIANGLKVLVLEQDLRTLENIGFRGNEYGMRELYSLDGTFSRPTVRDWRGAATMYPPYLECPPLELRDPPFTWNGFLVRRAWRCGNRGTVCSVPIEKPSIGDWMPVLHGGFDLQYAPVLEFREGRGVVVFSQLDLCGRTESDPESLQLLGRMLSRLDAASPKAVRSTFYLGDDRGRAVLKDLKIAYRDAAADQTFAKDSLLILGPGAQAGDLRPALQGGLQVLALGLAQEEIHGSFGKEVNVKSLETYSDYAEGLRDAGEYVGICNADVHWRKKLKLAAFDATSPGGMALQTVAVGSGKVVFCQVAPWMFEKDAFQYRTSLRRNHYLVSRLAHNLGASTESGLLDRLAPGASQGEPDNIDLSGEWAGVADPEDAGRTARYFDAAFQPGETWKPVAVPGFFDQQFEELKDYDGLFWYRKAFDLDAHLVAGRKYTLDLGAVDDESHIWLNGAFLGEVTRETNPTDYWGAERIHSVPGEKLKAQGNVLVVLCNDLRLGGGILGNPRLKWQLDYRLYPDTPQKDDNPYRYYRW